MLLMRAATAGNLTILHTCLNSGIDVHARASDGSTALHCAARAGQTEAAQFLLDRGAAFSCRNNRFRTPLEEAFLGRCSHTVKFLLHKTPPDFVIRATNWKDYVVRSGSLDIASLCIEHIGESFNAILNRQLLNIAIKFGRTVFFANLLEQSNTDINGKNSTGNTLFHKTVRYGNSEILRVLLASKNIDLNPATIFGDHPIHIASKKGNLEIMAILLSQKGIEARASNWEGNALHVAACEGQGEMVKFLLNRDDFDINSQDNSWKRTPLHYAAQHGHLEVVNILLSKGSIDQHRLDSDGEDSLHVAVAWGHSKTVETLLNHKSFKSSPPNWKGNLLTHVAAEKGHLGVLKLLLSHKSFHPHRANFNGKLPIHLAAANGHWDMVRLLLSHEPLHPSFDGTALINSAAANGHWDVVSMLLCDRDQANILGGHSSRTQKQRGGDVLQVVQRLLSHPDFQDVNAMIYNRRTLLHNAIRNFDSRLTEFLLAHKDIDVNRNEFDRYRDVARTPLHYAAENNNIEGARLLLGHKDIELLGDNTWGSTALDEARRQNHTEITNLIFSRFFNL